MSDSSSGPDEDSRPDLELMERPHASIRIHPWARPWHDLQDFRETIHTVLTPEFKAAHPGSGLITVDLPQGNWILFDKDRKVGPENEYVLFAAADPAYNRRLQEMWEAGGCTGSTADHVAPHRFEPAENAQEIRDALPKDASLKEGIEALLKTCKGCADLYFKDS